MSEFVAICIGCLVASLSLVSCHILFWGKGEPLVAYAIGTACLDLGLSVTGAILQNWLLIVVPWAVALVGGATVVLCWWVRGLREDWKRRDMEADRLLEWSRGETRKPGD